MKKIETEIIIETDPESIWDALMNFEAYSDWNPFIQSIKGEAVVGGKIDVTIGMKESKQMNFKPEILKVEVNKEFRWVGKLFLKGLFDGEHYFIIEEKSKGQVLFQHGERFSGLMTTPIFNMIEKGTINGFKAMNRAIKSRCEEVKRKEVRSVG